jgi:hypothetical protein
MNAQEFAEQAEERLAALTEWLGSQPYRAWVEDERTVALTGGVQGLMYVSVSAMTDDTTTVDIFNDGGPPRSIVFDWPWLQLPPSRYKPNAVRSREREMEWDFPVTVVLGTQVER